MSRIFIKFRHCSFTKGILLLFIIIMLIYLPWFVLVQTKAKNSHEFSHILRFFVEKNK